MSFKQLNTSDKANAQSLAEILTDPGATPTLKVKVIKKLIESKDNDNFFETMFEEGLSFGACPYCDHKNYWAIPVDALSQFGWLAEEEDERVKKHTTEEDCPRYQEACARKKVTT